MVGDIVTIKHRVIGLSPGRTADQIESDMEYHLWRIYIEGNPQSLAKIDHVDYMLLDPSFSRQLVHGNPGDQFSYEVNGYGSISLEVKIYRKNKLNEPLFRNYLLDISQAEGPGIEVDLNA
jgi:hypothetical protein